MGDLDHKDKQKAQQDERKRRSDIDDQDGAGDATHLLAWDADVEDFMEMLDKLLNGFRISMSSTEFHALTLRYRALSMAERRAVANRMQRRRLANLLRAVHVGDYRAYTDTWKAEAEQVRAHEETPGGDAP